MINTAVTSKRDIVRRHLLEELESGKYRVGDAFLTENNLSRELGICKNTVREAFSSLVSDGILVRRRGAGTFVHGLPSGDRRITLFTSDPRGRFEPFTAAILAGLHAALDDTGRRIDQVTIDPGMPKEGIDAYLAKSVPGDTVVVGGFVADRDTVDTLRRNGRQVIAIGMPDYDSDVPYVHTDHVGGIRMAAEYLLGKGHRSILLVDRGNSHAISYQDRRNSFIDTLVAHGVSPDARWLVDLFTPDYRNALESARRMLQRYREFTAVIVYGVDCALGFQDALTEAGLAEVELVPYYCNNCGGVSTVKLTTAEWSAFEMAQEAGNMIRSGKLERKLLPVTLYKSETK